MVIEVTGQAVICYLLKNDQERVDEVFEVLRSFLALVLEVVKCGPHY